MTTRRGFLGLLAGLAAFPFVRKTLQTSDKPRGYTTYLVGKDALIVDSKTYEYYNKVFVWEYQPSILWWSKESHA